MKRRGFIQVLFTLLGTTTIASLAYPLYRFLAPHKGEKQAKTVVMAKGDIRLGDAKEFVFDNIPAVILNRSGKGLIAFSRICTHLGCLVQFDKENKRLQCPCHAAIYDLEGNVLSGPPPKPLRKLPLRIEGETIVIG